MRALPPMLVCTWLGLALGLLLVLGVGLPSVAQAAVTPMTPPRAPRTLSLPESIALAHRQRSEIAAASLDVRRADLAVLRARLQRARLTVATSFTERAQRLAMRAPPVVCQTSPATCDDEAHLFGASASLAVPLWSGWTVEARIDGAQAVARAAVADERATASRVALEVSESYWAVRRAELLQQAGATVQVSNRGLEQVTRLKVEAGIAPRVDFNRVHVLVVRLEQQMNGLAADLDGARAQMGAALQIDEEFRLVDEPGGVAVDLPPLEDAEREALQSRGEVASARAQVEAAAKAVTGARGGYWPQVGLVGEARAENQLFFLPERSERVVVSALVGLEVNWTLFDSLGTFTTVRDAAYQRDRAQTDAARVVALVREQVRASHAGLRHSVSRRVLAEQAVGAQRESVDILRRRYEVGSALLVEVLLAQVDLSQLEFDLVDAIVAIAAAQARLDAARGRL